MNIKKRLKLLRKEMWFPRNEFLFCKKNNDEEGDCFSCRILNLCFKKNKILRLKSLGYKFNSMEILTPIFITHRERRNAEKNNNIKFKNLNHFKENSISLSKLLCQFNNNLNRISLLNGQVIRSLYFYFVFNMDYTYRRKYETIITLKFNFATPLLNIEEKYVEEDEDIDEENTIINRKRVRLGLSSEIRKKIYKRDNHTCFYCGWKNGKNGEFDKPLTMDHIIPSSHGGTSKDDNLVTCCWDCNIKKNDKFLKEVVDNWTFEPENSLKVKQYLFENKLNTREEV